MVLGFDVTASDEHNSSEENDISDILELTVFEWTKIAILMSDGTRGPYNQSPKSKDFFLTLLQALDCYFRKMLFLHPLQNELTTYLLPAMVGRDTFDSEFSVLR